MNPEKPVQEQVKAELAQGLQALLTAQPQPSNLNEVKVDDIVLAAMSSTGAQAEKKFAAFFPALDEQAKSVLATIGGAEDVIVVPDSINMQGTNKAITMKSPDQVELYRGFVETGAQRFPSVDTAALKNRVTENTILVKESLLSAGQLEMSGTIWHEHGHVLFDAAETGLVFAHEIRVIGEHLSDLVVKWIKETRTLAYFARYVSDPGMDDLERELEKVLSQEDINEYRRIRYNVVNKVKVAEKEAVIPELTVVKIGQTIEGTIEELRYRMAPGDGVINGEMKQGKQVSAGECTWMVDAHFPDDDRDYDTFKVRRLT